MSGEPHTAQEVALRCVDELYAADNSSQRLGIEIDEVSPGRARARMAVSSEMVNGHGIGHGGYVFLLADTAFAFACNTHGQATVARAAEIVFLRPAHTGDVLSATAVERTRSGRNGIYDVTVTRADGEVVAEFRGHSATLSGPGRQP